MEVCSPHDHVCAAEPHTGFHIAFKMLDVDGNEHVDKKEFLKVRFRSLAGGFSHVFDHTVLSEMTGGYCLF